MGIINKLSNREKFMTLVTNDAPETREGILLRKFQRFLNSLTEEEFKEKWEAASIPNCDSPLVEDLIASFKEHKADNKSK